MRWKILPLITVMFVVTVCASNTYNVKLKNAQTLLENRNYEQAKTEIQRLIEAYPEKPQPYYLLGTLHYLRENYYECLINFDKADRYGFERTFEYDISKGIALYHTGNFEKAETNLRHSIDISSTAIAHKYLGIIRYEAGDYSGAVNSLREASAHFSDDVNTLFHLGLALYREGEITESLPVFRRALSLAPENVEIMFHTAHLLMLDGQFREAASLYAKIPPESPFRDESMYNLSEAYIRLGKYDSAITTLKYCIEKHPDDYDALSNLSAALVKTGDYTSAVDILINLYNSDTHDIRVVYNLGLAYQGLEAYEQSLRHFSFAVEQNPDNTDYRYAYALSLTKIGDIEKAREQMKSIISLDPAHKDAREWLERNPETYEKKK